VSASLSAATTALARLVGSASAGAGLAAGARAGWRGCAGALAARRCALVSSTARRWPAPFRGGRSSAFTSAWLREFHLHSQAEVALHELANVLDAAALAVEAEQPARLGTLEIDDQARRIVEPRHSGVLQRTDDVEHQARAAGRAIGMHALHFSGEGLAAEQEEDEKRSAWALA
jgi:hypothetical protein